MALENQIKENILKVCGNLKGEQKVKGIMAGFYT